MINYSVRKCNLSEIKPFIEKWHYSHNTNGLHVSYCFKLINNHQIIGGMIFGLLGMANVWKKYAKLKEDVLELNRLCCVDKTPKNTESFFIGKALKWLKRNTYVKKIISYADPFYNHKGIIYKASNFKYLGLTSSSKKINYKGKLFHDKSIRTKYKNKLKPFARELKEALDSKEAFYIKTPPKHIYIYEFKRKKYHPKYKRPIQRKLVL